MIDEVIKMSEQEQDNGGQGDEGVKPPAHRQPSTVRVKTAAIGAGFALLTGAGAAIAIAGAVSEKGCPMVERTIGNGESHILYIGAVATNGQGETEGTEQPLSSEEEGQATAAEAPDHSATIVLTNNDGTISFSESNGLVGDITWQQDRETGNFTMASVTPTHGFAPDEFSFSSPAANSSIEFAYPTNPDC